jgi:hypothetical protein
MLDKITAIYGLFDPRNPEVVMYVGKGLSQRASQHWKDFLSKGMTTNAPLRLWFNKLRSEGVELGWCFLEENLVDWENAERKWIAYWREKNPELCNVAPGGNSFSLESSRLGGFTKAKLYPNAGRDLGLKHGYKGSLGKSVGGRKTHQLHPNLAFENGKKGGLVGGHRVHELHPEMAHQCGKLVHRLHPTLASENGHRTHELHKDDANYGELKARGTRRMNELYPQMAKEAGKMGGKIGGPAACHKRWHLDRGIINPNCKLCQEALNVTGVS